MPKKSSPKEAESSYVPEAEEEAAAANFLIPQNESGLVIVQPDIIPINMTYMKERYTQFSTWFQLDDNNHDTQQTHKKISNENNNNNKQQKYPSSDYEIARNKSVELKTNADKNGPIIDFIVAGNPKSGTTTLSNNLALIAPMPTGDMCLDPKALVTTSYLYWAQEDNNNNPNKNSESKQKEGHQQLYTGIKCPRYVSTPSILTKFSKYLPKTKIIIGIRHPILWFQSFWNMQATNHISFYQSITPYTLTKTCANAPICTNFCNKQLFCVHRSRFHIALAQMGKTPLSQDEYSLLAPNDFDGGPKIQNFHIRNPIFLYEQTQLTQEYFWDELSTFLDYPNATTISHDQIARARGKKENKNRTDINRLDVCQEENDSLRQLMMPYAYEISQWTCRYFIQSKDVYVANPTKFCEILKEFEKDPCGKFVRDEMNGEYVLPAAMRV